MDTPLVSVVIPTYERADLLRRTLDALLRQTLDPADCEIIVVDNNSTDATRETVERMASRRTVAGRGGEAPAIRYVFEGRQGLSHAKNTGLEAARASIVAYIDDDALASPDWLRLILWAFERVEPDPHVVGGPAFPLFLGWRRPSWYKDGYEIASWGEAPRFLERSEYFFGLNVAFRRDTLLGAGGFDRELGMKGQALGFAEDAEVIERLWEYADGRLSVYYVPEAFVRHLIPDARLNPHYALRRAFANGQTLYQQEYAASPGGPLGLLPRAAYRLARSAGKETLRTFQDVATLRKLDD